MAHTAASERKALAEALHKVPDDAPTLCEGWNARDLAVHIVVRDSRPDLLAGERLPVVGGHAKVAVERLRRADYQSLVSRVDAGPPRWSPMRLRPVDNMVNTVEFYVHAEDVLRAQRDYQPSSRRAVSPEVRGQLWKQGAQGVFLLAARSQHRRITFLSPGYGAVTRGRSHDPLWVVQGSPEELVLWAFGRRSVADVDLRPV